MIILKAYGKGNEVTDIQMIPVDPFYTKREIDYFCKKHTSQVMRKYWTYTFIIEDRKKYNLYSIYEMFREHVNYENDTVTEITTPTVERQR